MKEMEESNIMIPKKSGEGEKQTLEMNKDVLEQMQKELSRLTKLSEQKEEIIQQVSSIEGLDERVIEVIKSQEKKNQELFPSEKF